MKSSAGTLPELKKHSFAIDLVKRLLKEKPLGTIGAAIFLALLLVGIFASFVAPYGMNETHVADRLLPPSPTYLLGTDQLGRDLLSEIIFGARISVVIGISASLIGTTIATVIGGLSAWFGGLPDLIVQRLVDAWMSIPGLLLAITVMSIVPRGVFPIIIVISITAGIGGSRVLRSAVIGIKEKIYIQAGQAIGCSTQRLLMRHVLPNIMGPVIITFTLGVGSAILVESGLSFLGFGVPPGIPTWGSMLSLQGRQYMEIAPGIALYPGIALSLTVYGINVFGDALRDLTDPRLRGGLGRYGRSKKSLLKLGKKTGPHGS